MNEQSNLKKVGVNKNLDFRLLWMLLGICIVSSVLIIIWLCKFGNAPQIYKDIVLEQLAREFANKSIELKLYILVAAIGIIALFIAYIKKPDIFNGTTAKWTDDKLVALCIFAFMIGLLVFWGRLCINIILILFTAFVTKRYTDVKVPDAIVLFILSLYSLFACYEIINFFGQVGDNQTVAIVLELLAFIFCVAVILKANDKISKWITLLQIPIPFLLLIYLVSRYSYNDKIIYIRPNIYVYIIIIGLIICSLIVIIYKLKTYGNRADEIKDCISYFSVVAIMAYNRFSGSGFIMTTDMHHPAENTIAYNELINLGQKYYSEYVPVSGLFSLVQGAFLQLFGDNRYVAYYITNNIFYLCIILIIVVALRLHLNSIMTLLLAVFICVDDYSRVPFIVPFMLILTAKKLIKRPIMWFNLWFIFSLFYGLYYPAYGFAVMISMLPTALYLLPRMRVCFIEADKTRKVIFTMNIVISIIIAAAFMPLLIKTAQHVIDMSDGLIYYESISVFGRYPPESFMRYLTSHNKLRTIRLIITYIIEFLSPALVLWFAISSFLLAIIRKKTNGFAKMPNWSYENTNILGIFILSLMCFYFSLHRGIFFKTNYIIVYSLIILIIFLYEYDIRSYTKYIIIIIASFSFSIINEVGIENVSEKAFAEYIVPGDYSYIEQNEDYPNIGTGFVKTDLLTEIQNASARFGELDNDKNYFMLYSSGDAGMAYDQVLNIKGTGMVEPYLVRGRKLTEYQIRTLLNTDAIVGTCISPVDHYYLYKWLMTSGQYIWDNTNSMFVQVNNQKQDDIINSNAKAIMSFYSGDVGEYGATLGNSVHSLAENVINKTNISYEQKDVDPFISIEFDQSIIGNDVDYIYVEAELDNVITPYILDGNYTEFNQLDYYLLRHKYNDGLKIVAEWDDNFGGKFTMYSDVENGKILLPIGAGTRWLCNNHSYVRIWFEQNGNIIHIPRLKEISLYKLRDIDIEN